MADLLNRRDLRLDLLRRGRFTALRPNTVRDVQLLMSKATIGIPCRRKVVQNAAQQEAAWPRA